ncbi:hypothetical protein HOLleu_31557 [Holothuria leucospilota]|uniref:Uncharacterized protein n=1 Tax=Holothuria leucospilota TaxID=206669 RepID=A0A9Q0YU95_HOLLE|nr:hypothetical protein HOLleu_31557 [Holothuria leucospilota]
MSNKMGGHFTLCIHYIMFCGCRNCSRTRSRSGTQIFPRSHATCNCSGVTVYER